MTTSDEVMLLAARIEAARRKQVALLRDLAVSLDVQARVGDLDVVALAFRESALTPVQAAALAKARAHRLWKSKASPLPYSDRDHPWIGRWIDWAGKVGATWYNVAVLDDGTEVVLEPMVLSAAGRVLPPLGVDEVQPVFCGGVADGLHHQAG